MRRLAIHRRMSPAPVWRPGPPPRGGLAGALAAARSPALDPRLPLPLPGLPHLLQAGRVFGGGGQRLARSAEEQRDREGTRCRLEMTAHV